MTGAKRTSDDSDVSTSTRLTSSSGGSPGALPAIARSSSVRLIVHGLKPTSPSVTVRPSAAPSFGGSCHRRSAGTASQVATHSSSTTPRTHPNRFNQTTPSSPCQRAADRRASGLAIPVVEIVPLAMHAPELPGFPVQRARGRRKVLVRVGVFDDLGVVLRADRQVLERRIRGVDDLVRILRA